MPDRGRLRSWRRSWAHRRLAAHAGSQTAHVKRGVTRCPYSQDVPQKPYIGCPNSTKRVLKIEYRDPRFRWGASEVAHQTPEAGRGVLQVENRSTKGSKCVPEVKYHIRHLVHYFCDKYSEFRPSLHDCWNVSGTGIFNLGIPCFYSEIRFLSLGTAWSG